MCWRMMPFSPDRFITRESRGHFCVSAIQQKEEVDTVLEDQIFCLVLPFLSLFWYFCYECGIMWIRRRNR